VRVSLVAHLSANTSSVVQGYETRFLGREPRSRGAAAEAVAFEDEVKAFRLGGSWWLQGDPTRPEGYSCAHCNEASTHTLCLRKRCCTQAQVIHEAYCQKI